MEHCGSACAALDLLCSPDELLHEKSNFAPLLGSPLYYLIMTAILITAHLTKIEARAGIVTNRAEVRGFRQATSVYHCHLNLK